MALECVVTGEPQPTVYWEGPPGRAQAPGLEGGGASGVPGRETAIYVINSITRADEGFYTCYANNNLGQAQKRIQIIGQLSILIEP